MLGLKLIYLGKRGLRCQRVNAPVRRLSLDMLWIQVVQLSGDIRTRAYSTAYWHDMLAWRKWPKLGRTRVSSDRLFVCLCLYRCWLIIDVIYLYCTVLSLSNRMYVGAFRIVFIFYSWLFCHNRLSVSWYGSRKSWGIVSQISVSIYNRYTVRICLKCAIFWWFRCEGKTVYCI